MAKHIFVTGGVVSSLGKGITAASLGRLLKSRGFKVTIQKLDPYLNVDPGTMSPFQHGEVFVTDDGTETDLDLGHYERFIDENLGKDSNVTAGQIYWSIVTKERRGEFLGGTVQVIPHVTNEIKQRILNLATNDDKHIVITEVGGTVGDIESLPFLEAIRQFKKDVGKENVLYIHVTLVPYLESSSELKTKPTQHSVKELRSIGIQPDIIVARCDRPIDVSIKRKIGLFCDIEPASVITAIDADNLYVIPLKLHEEGLDDIVVDRLKLKNGTTDLSEWQGLVERIRRVENKVKIGLVGKYVQLPDAYLSVVEALKHGGYFNNTDVEIVWVDAETVSQEEVERQLASVDGILVPGGFGIRGIEGKIHAIRFARENKLPFLGVCLGLQCAVVEFARNVVGLEGANSSEFDPETPHPVIDLLPEQKTVEDMGGTMRLGAYPCKITKDSYAYRAYGATDIEERHRHRYEVNSEYIEALVKAGLVLSGLSPDGRLVEIVEIKDHPWFVGTQFHPEFKSRPNRPQPLFRDFVGAALKYNLDRQRVGATRGYFE
ncbi:MAG: CTP synthase [Candidatus Aquicultor secundus]|uniref:CTP synthase n=1 Tax=Candidatus Aquicultor secundus TaxID=1973895 RepID=A0A2M7T6Y2_9ACTN|nr:CTP synthase [Candidatus Aquicultor secundus]NCO66064.1 CTP synthase [Solirubrobacter sp.]OIO84460.1 MAG: CTP synthase [Candidatus Aquicultor secundus]PIU27673.1 MAG: CTP synthase [Candidatus Aquicultor secundus]PIW22387.1 MAG: CTP synthase [Candidatus Aquicultor secundus]PIX52707.1 MAG: CTP synthase [Candidatus Aquicultor secundus]